MLGPKELPHSTPRVSSSTLSPRSASTSVPSGRRSRVPRQSHRKGSATASAQAVDGAKTSWTDSGVGNGAVSAASRSAGGLRDRVGVDRVELLLAPRAVTAAGRRCGKRGIGSTRCQASRPAVGSAPADSAELWRSQRTVLHSMSVGPPPLRRPARDGLEDGDANTASGSLPSTIATACRSRGAVGDVRGRLDFEMGTEICLAVVLADQHRRTFQIRELMLSVSKNSP